MSSAMGSRCVVIVGGGPAGISAALSLWDLGVRTVVVERGDQVGAAWRGRYDRLRLNTGRRFSHLPGRQYPKGTPMFPTRDQLVDHLDRHSREEGIELRLATTVHRVDRRGLGWRLTTSVGELDARRVVIATGYQHTPVFPEVSGTFSGELLHACDYRNPGPFCGKRVLVIGAGSSGLEIAHDLATGAAAQVWLSVRTPPNILPRFGPAGLPNDVLSIPLFHLPVGLADRVAISARRRAFGDLSRVGLPIPDEGPFARARRLHVAPTVVDGDTIDVVRAGGVQMVSAVTAFEDADVCLSNGSSLRPDVVISATGYHTGLAPLVGHLGVLNCKQVPLKTPRYCGARGLYFHGLVSRPALIGYMARQSRTLAKEIVEGS